MTSFFIRGGFGYSLPKGSVLNRLGFTATYVDWTEKDILAPREEGVPVGGQAMKFTPLTKFEFGTKHKFEAGAALSFVTGTRESAGVSDVRADITYTYMDDSAEGQLPAFKLDLSGSLNRLDWWNPDSPLMWGIQAKGSVGRFFWRHSGDDRRRRDS
ncbi:MAG TPA: hypothetical protein VFV34_18465 [Blastocatellia bacterium]|nr:hypothetical protein [Blastocatellia bacterium]